MLLTDIAIRSARPTDKQQRLFDGNGLYLEASPSGGKWWRLKYRIDGKEKRLSIGVYPDVSLRAAREESWTLRKQISAGIDPAIVRKTAKIMARSAAENTFEAVAREWHLKFLSTWNSKSCRPGTQSTPRTSSAGWNASHFRSSASAPSIR